MFKLNDIQSAIFKTRSKNVHMALLIEIIEGTTEFDSLNEAKQLEILEITNACYRAKFPVIEDLVFDGFESIFKLSNSLGESHPFLINVQPEDVVEGKTLTLPQPMLSTDKAYSEKDIKKWLVRIEKAADKLGVAKEDIIIRATPKLDGFAAYDDGETFYTRGNGKSGTDISHVFKRGLQVAGGNGRGQKQGEIVISKTYFAEHLSAYFDNTRNVQSSVLAEKTVDERVQKAIEDGAVVFHPFSRLESWEGTIADLLAEFEGITENILTTCDYDLDGVVFECTNDDIKQAMGATRKSHRWQIALKKNEATADVGVLDVIPQTSKNGRLTPVLDLNPTRLSGATFTRVTAHHYGNIRDKKIGKGSVIQLVRAGLVIPKIESVIKSTGALLPENCPCCDSKLEWIEDNLFCLNSSECKDQIEKKVIHFFDILGTVDGFGGATVATLNKHGVSDIYATYLLENDTEKLYSMGYKEKTVNNLVLAIKNSKLIQVEDWRFLSSFGVHRLGGGTSEKLLSHHHITEIFDLTVADLIKIKGFAKKSANKIVGDLALMKEMFFNVYSLGFNLEITPNVNDVEQVESPIAGKLIVFTGTMLRGKREDMAKHAKTLGAKIGKSVSGKTDYLVTGEKVGAKKLEDAKAKGKDIKIISEDEYLELLLSNVMAEPTPEVELSTADAYVVRNFECECTECNADVQFSDDDVLYGQTITTSCTECGEEFKVTFPKSIPAII